MVKVLLYSGGTDSWLIDKLWKPDKKIYINIHGLYSKQEIARLPKDVEIVDFPFLGQMEDKKTNFVPLRNLYFLMIASHYGNKICLGATAGDGGKDKNLHFLKETEKMLKYLWQDKKVSKDIIICKDFVTKSKPELMYEYLKSGGTLKELKEQTFSCYHPLNGKECQSCYPCFRKFALLYALGYPYSEVEEKSMWQYIKQNIIPTREQGGYPGTYYTDRGTESLYLVRAVELLKEKYGL